MSHRDTKSRRVASVGRTKNNHRYAVTSHNPLVNLELSRGTSMIRGPVPSKPTNLFRIGAPVHTKSHKRKRSPSPTHTRKKKQRTGSNGSNGSNGSKKTGGRKGGRNGTRGKNAQGAGGSHKTAVRNRRFDNTYLSNTVRPAEKAAYPDTVVAAKPFTREQNRILDENARALLEGDINEGHRKGLGSSFTNGTQKWFSDAMREERDHQDIDRAEDAGLTFGGKRMTRHTKNKVGGRRSTRKRNIHNAKKNIPIPIRLTYF